MYTKKDIEEDFPRLYAFLINKKDPKLLDYFLCGLNANNGNRTPEIKYLNMKKFPKTALDSGLLWVDTNSRLGIDVSWFDLHEEFMHKYNFINIEFNTIFIL